jgi:hypothetical protein
MADQETSIVLDNGRRKFLNWFLSTTAGAFVVAVFYPLSRYLIPPKSRSPLPIRLRLRSNRRK